MESDATPSFADILKAKESAAGEITIINFRKIFADKSESEAPPVLSDAEKKKLEEKKESGEKTLPEFKFWLSED